MERTRRAVLRLQLRSGAAAPLSVPDNFLPAVGGNRNQGTSRAGGAECFAFREAGRFTNQRVSQRRSMGRPVWLGSARMDRGSRIAPLRIHGGGRPDFGEVSVADGSGVSKARNAARKVRRGPPGRGCQQPHSLRLSLERGWLWMEQRRVHGVIR